MRVRRAQPFLVSALLGCVLCSCTTEPTRAESSPPPGRATNAPPTHTVDPPEVDLREVDSSRPQMVEDEEAPVGPDLKRLAKTFVRYAVGNSDTFPHGESVSMAIGGEPVLSIDDITAALSNRKIWKVCPADWDIYGASSCPINLLGPIKDAVANHALVVFAAVEGDVTCAPARSGSLPRGHLVVLRPDEEWRTCASDFALALVADEQGQLLHIDLTLASP